MIKKQICIHLMHFQIFIMSPKPENENSEIRESLQRRHNTEP